ELRRLLVGPEQQELVRLRERLDEQDALLPADVGRVLPEAVTLRSRKDRKITQALMPTVEEAIGISVKKNPQTLIDALFPVIGPAIRRAISEALTGMVQTMNQSLEHSLSVQGLRWRLEAWRTGKSFGEVVLLHTLLYRVEQVFLIHRETGLLLQHVTASNVAAQDADMVSGMLTAIQDFVHDSFNAPEGDQLETLQVGELTVWIEQGPLAILAGVIRGTAPQELRDVFRSTIESIHLQYHDALAEFSGDAASFDATRPLLEDCLESQFDSEHQAASSKRQLISLAVVAGVIVIALLVWAFFAWRSARRWDAYVERLKNEPGIVVTETGKREGKYFINGLRDPLARDPSTLLPEARLDASDVIGRWQPFQAMSTDFVLARATKLLEPPATVKLSVEDDGVLRAEGFASRQWIMEMRRVVRFVPGLSQFNEDRLLDLDRIENPLLFFELDQTQLAVGQEEKLRQLVADIERLQSLAEAMRKNIRLEITGRADGTGTEERNSELSRGRAQAIANELKARLPSRTN
ncbi:MAG: OmpA family protein, partial [Pyrinomonadaceae bacterium]|nr:OmpA family protein [Pyrinomonadaceae bacterium]